jgi:hypothetical protein
MPDPCRRRREREGAASEETTTCWCCGREYDEAGVLRLGARPEAAVCVDCAYHLGRRARERTASAGPVRVLYRTGGRIRETVTRRGWPDLPVLGAIVRRIGRHLPW